MEYENKRCLKIVRLQDKDERSEGFKFCYWSYNAAPYFRGNSSHSIWTNLFLPSCGYSSYINIFLSDWLACDLWLFADYFYHHVALYSLCGYQNDSTCLSSLPLPRCLLMWTVLYPLKLRRQVCESFELCTVSVPPSRAFCSRIWIQYFSITLRQTTRHSWVGDIWHNKMCGFIVKINKVI
jgi:hypothetical protein